MSKRRKMNKGEALLVVGMIVFAGLVTWWGYSLQGRSTMHVQKSEENKNYDLSQLNDLSAVDRNVAVQQPPIQYIQPQVKNIQPTMQPQQVRYIERTKPVAKISRVEGMLDEIKEVKVIDHDVDFYNMDREIKYSVKLRNGSYTKITRKEIEKVGQAIKNSTCHHTLIIKGEIFETECYHFVPHSER